MKSGTERCFMAHPSGKYTLWTMGRQNIDAKLMQGWTIVESDRNHLAGQDPKAETVSTPCENDPVKAENKELAQTAIPVEVQRKRPRIRDNNAKERGTR